MPQKGQMTTRFDRCLLRQFIRPRYERRKLIQADFIIQTPVPGGTGTYYPSCCQYQYLLKCELYSLMIYEHTFTVPCPMSTHGHKKHTMPGK